MCHRVEITMPCEAASVPAARHWAAGQLGQMYGEGGDAARDVELVVSELVSNCVRAHAHHFVLALDGHHDGLRIEVTDDAPGQPTPRAAGPTDQNGRGLLIVEHLATDWGLRAAAPGKTVWAAFAIATGWSPTFDCAPTR